MSLTENMRILLEYGFRNDILSDVPYYQAAEEVADLGAAVVPELEKRLGKSRFIAIALGMIGTPEALSALAGSLDSRTGAGSRRRRGDWAFQRTPMP